LQVDQAKTQDIAGTHQHWSRDALAVDEDARGRAVILDHDRGASTPYDDVAAADREVVEP